MKRYDRARWLFCLAVTPWLSGLGCQDPDEPPPDCDRRLGADARGRWTIEGEGRRKNCRDPFLNGEMKLEVRPFWVDAEPVATHDNSAGEDTQHEADAFVRRIQRAQYVLDSDSTPARVSFEGSVNTCAIAFTVTERLSDGSVHSYEFDGFVESAYRIYGEFTGEGPGPCEVEGEFEVEIE